VIENRVAAESAAGQWVGGSLCASSRGKKKAERRGGESPNGKRQLAKRAVSSYRQSKERKDRICISDASYWEGGAREKGPKREKKMIGAYVVSGHIAESSWAKG